MKWTTFDGRVADTDTADHQHISNCVWYSTLFGLPRETTRMYIEVLKERFENKILPYRAIPWFYSEILGLINLGYIYINDLGDVLIIVNGKVIGEVLKSDHPHFERLKK